MFFYASMIRQKLRDPAGSADELQDSARALKAAVKDLSKSWSETPLEPTRQAERYCAKRHPCSGPRPTGRGKPQFEKSETVLRMSGGEMQRIVRV